MENEAKKRVLIVTYYWPPSGGAGVQRWLKFSKYLPDHGWDPIVFTPENPDFDQRDESLLEEVNPEIEVLKFPIWEPYRMFKKLSGTKELRQGQILENRSDGIFKRLAIWLRGNFFIPDPRVFWVKPVAEYLLSIVDSNEIKHVITTGPPHSVHLIGRRLKLKNPALTWVADFRDPWTGWDILSKMKISRFVWSRHKKMEASVLKIADSVLATGPIAAKEFKALGARRAKAITNGFDQSDVERNQSIQPQKGRFVISHVGMLSANRNPKALWSALDELCNDDRFYRAFELRLTGILSQEVLDTINALPNLSSKLIARTSVAHGEVFVQYQESNVLVLAQTNSIKSASQLPGKLFEYLSVKRPILALGQKDSDVSKVLKDTSSGQLFDYSDQAGIKAFVEQEFKTWTGDSEQVNWQHINIEQYERKNLTAELAGWLDTL